MLFLLYIECDSGLVLWSTRRQHMAANLSAEAQKVLEKADEVRIATTYLQFPNAVVLNAVGRGTCKCAQKTANASPQKSAREAQKSANARAQKSAKERKRAQKSVRWRKKRRGRKRKSAKRVQKSTKGRKRALPRKNCKQPGLNNQVWELPKLRCTGILWPCYRGHLGPLRPKWPKEFEMSFRVLSAPGI